MKAPKCIACGHSVAEFSYHAVCPRLDCWCYPHGACPWSPPKKETEETIHDDVEVAV